MTWLLWLMFAWAVLYPFVTLLYDAWTIRRYQKQDRERSMPFFLIWGEAIDLCGTPYPTKFLGASHGPTFPAACARYFSDDHRYDLYNNTYDGYALVDEPVRQQTNAK